MKKFIFLICLFFCNTVIFSQSEKVTISKNEAGIKIKLDDKDFFIKGMNWDYFPIGTNYSYILWDQPEGIIKKALANEMTLLKNMNVNTIRVYDDIPKKWIEYIYKKYGIYTMLNHRFGRYGLTINGNWVANTDYSDTETRKIILEEVKKLATDYKDTPGLLLFLLGNENNYGLFWQGAETENIPAQDQKSTIQAQSLYSLFNEATLAMKAIENAKPIAICNGDLMFLDIIAKECPDVDILGINVYRGLSFGDLFEKVKNEYGKPVLLTEFGSDAYNNITHKEDQFEQAKILKSNWEEVYENAAGIGKSNNCIGGFTFQFSDGWWKHEQTTNLEVHDTHASWFNGGYTSDFVKGENNINEEWFGICAKGPIDKSGTYPLYPRTAYYTLKNIHRLNTFCKRTSLKKIQKCFNKIQIKKVSQKSK